MDVTMRFLEEEDRDGLITPWVEDTLNWWTMYVPFFHVCTYSKFLAMFLGSRSVKQQLLPRSSRTDKATLLRWKPHEEDATWTAQLTLSWRDRQALNHLLLLQHADSTLCIADTSDCPVLFHFTYCRFTLCWLLFYVYDTYLFPLVHTLCPTPLPRYYIRDTLRPTSANLHKNLCCLINL